jgi:hypothetical protein
VCGGQRTGEVVTHKPDCKFYRPPQTAPKPSPAEAPPYSHPQQWSATEDWISATQLRRQPRTAIIAGVQTITRETPRGKVETTALTFKGMRQKLALNKTCKTWLMESFGDDQRAAIGRAVTMYCGEVHGKPATLIKSPPAATEALMRESGPNTTPPPPATLEEKRAAMWGDDNESF